MEYLGTVLEVSGFRFLVEAVYNKGHTTYCLLRDDTCNSYLEVEVELLPTEYDDMCLVVLKPQGFQKVYDYIKNNFVVLEDDNAFLVGGIE